VAQRETQDDRRTQERAEITARIARFKSTQERFAREREEYARQAWRKAQRGEAAE
jgi:chorismate mutase